MNINVKISLEKIIKLRKYILGIMEERKIGFNQLKIKAELNSKTLTDLLYSDTKERINPFYLQRLGYALKIDYKELYKIIGYLKPDDCDINDEPDYMKLDSIILPVYGKSNLGKDYINLSAPVREENLVLLPGSELPKESFMVEIHGDSMYPTLMNGDLAVIDPNFKNIKNNELYLITYDEKTCIKRVIESSGYIQLISDNSDRKKYPDTIILKDENINFVCNGIVAESKRKFKK